MRSPIVPVVIGDTVQFDSEHGPQVGTIADIKSDVSSGCRVAAVQVADTLDGQPWHVPVVQLQHVAVEA